MKENVQKIKWVAVRVVRGFIIEARGFKRKSDAEKLTKQWSKTINQDYDDIAVLPLIIGD